mgnify:CR=1 FL=1|tara:strand:+ start:2189 stop:3229 length:1041 start_codon:yes stop_codon:yes gene_type:complete
MSQGTLEIISINGQASIQDLGRLNAQHLGFSASGAADEFAFLSANKLISNKLSDRHQQHIAEINNQQYQCAAIEITLGQISLQANAACIIAITGADCHAQINNNAVDNWQCYQLKAGDIVDFAMPTTGLHSYLAVFGGFTCQSKQQPWLGSFSQTRNEMALGFTGQTLTMGSKLHFSAQTQSFIKTGAERPANRATSTPTLFYAKEKLTLRIMPSRLFLQMRSAQQQQFLATEYVISPDSNRMGYRLAVQQQPQLLTNEKILSQPLRNSCLLSMPVTYGMVQFPENEQPIILMKERQTMGGYPVLGTVMQTDLFRLSQMRPGEKVSFILISYQQAQQQLRAFYQKL